MPQYRIRYDKVVAPNDLHPDGVPKGAEYDVPSLTDAKKRHPDATIVGTVEPNGTIAPYEEPKPVRTSHTHEDEESS